VKHLHWKYAVPALILFLLVPLFVEKYTLHIFIMSLYYIIMVTSWNVLSGYAGQMSFAQATFSTFAGYVSTLLAINFGLTPFVTTIIAALATCLLGFLLGVICMKSQGIYHALMTIAFAQIFRITINIEYKITRGSLGLSSIPLFGISKIPYYYYILFLTVLTLLILDRILSSPIGLTLRAIKEDKTAATSIGINEIKYRQIAFLISSVFAGLAGAFLAHYTLIVSPESATISAMAIIIAMAIIGGQGSFFGPVIGAIGLQFLMEYLRDFGRLYLVILGIIMVLVIRFLPEGVVPKLSKIVSTYLDRKKIIKKDLNFVKNKA